MQSEITILPNGLRVLSVTNKQIETVSLGIWVKTGSAYEKAEVNGISHFLEHTAFKGTKKRTSLQITEEIENVGGHTNAYTSREFTAFYAKMLKNDAELALDVLSDLLMNPTFPREEIIKERDVVVQEIKQAADTPDDAIFDYYQTMAYPDQAIGRPILGPESCVRTFLPETIRDYLEHNYAGENMIVAAVGNIEHRQFVEMVRSRMGDLRAKTNFVVEPQKFVGGFFKEKRCIEQAHVAVGFEGFNYYDPHYYPVIVFSTLFGGGMSSRLFQEIREKRGLAYSVYSFTTSHTQSGNFGIYAGTGPDELKNLVPVFAEEIKKVCQEKVRPEELARAKAQLKASLLMNLENSASVAEVFSRQHLLFDRVIPTEEMVERIDQVSLEDLQNTAQKIFSSNPNYILVGAVDNCCDYETFCKMLKQ